MDVSVDPTGSYNRIAAQTLMERIAAGPLVMQGPMGSVFQGEPCGEDLPAALWNLEEPQTVERLHALYAHAGAQVLLTNTFQASGPCLSRDRISQSVGAVNRAAVDCARAAVASMGAMAPAVMGSMGPCGIAWFGEDDPRYLEAREAYREQACALLEASADALLLETFTSRRDLVPALAGALDAADGMPVLVSFAVDDDGNLLGDGMNIEGAAMLAEREGAAAVGVNCCSIEAATACVLRMAQATGLPLMVRPSAGLPHREGDALVWDERPQEFAAACTRWVADGASLVGACCGTTPRTVAAMAEALDSQG